MALREREPIDCDLRQVVEHGNPVLRRVVVGGSIGHFDQQASGAVDQKRQEVVGGDQMSVDGEAENPEPLLEVDVPRSACSSPRVRP